MEHEERLPQTPGVEPAWRVIGQAYLSDSLLLHRAALAARVNPVTVKRWMNGTYEPRPANLLDVMQCIVDQAASAEEQTRLVDQLWAEQIPVRRPAPVHATQEIAASCYKQALSLLSQTPGWLRYMTLCRFVLRQALEHLDASGNGFLLLVVHCLPPHADGRVHTIQARISMGSGIWESEVEPQHRFFGKDSLIGYQLRSFPLCHHPFPLPFEPIKAEERSTFAYPLLREGKVGGGLLACSTQPDYFCLWRQEVLAEYAALLALALPPDEFYDATLLDLATLPPVAEQEHIMSRFHPSGGERDVWQQVETALLCWHPPSINQAQADASSSPLGDASTPPSQG